ncbi:LysE family translocator [Gallaecimonas sp. GXIMD4217]|uniref:LysE family translocator n=1 Tax=Gallaecimonas sp. GXIMD4217 TaxID=3131927 RepID=UPI00311B39EB
MTTEQFLLLAGAHFLAVASPGPDFAVVSRHAIAFGRHKGMQVALGVGTGILVHMLYTWAGVALLLKQNPTLEMLFSVAAALYLAWMGVGALRASTGLQLSGEAGQVPGFAAAFRRGFLVNALNPKATLFFLTLFGVVLSAAPSGWTMVGIAAYLSIATGLWFVVLSVLLTAGPLGRFLAAKGYWVDRLLGLVLLALAAKLLWGLAPA